LREEARTVGSRFSEGLASRARDRYRRQAPVDEQVWLAMLSTPGGAGAVARAAHSAPLEHLFRADSSSRSDGLEHCRSAATSVRGDRRGQAVAGFSD
jgi:hypothetical protein